MRCDEASERISLLIDGELAGDERRMLLEHVEGCVTCRRCRDELKRLQQHLAQAHQHAPRALLHRVRGALASEAAAQAVARKPQTLPARIVTSMRSRWRPLVFQAAAVLLACLFTAGATVWLTHGADTQAALAKDVMSAHMRALLQDNPVQVASLDTHTVKPWFAGRVEYTPVVKDLSSEGFQLVGGRLDYVGGRRVATLVYHHRLHQISVFTWPASGGDSSPATMKVNGYNILTWTKGGMTYWAVSDLNDGELKQLQALL